MEMYQVVCTCACDNADDAVVKVLDYTDKDTAVACFNEKLKELIGKAAANEYLQLKMSMHHHKALVQIEGTQYLVALIKNGGLFSN